MAEQPRNPEAAEPADAPSGASTPEAATDGAPDQDVRDVVGRRGYDEAEDETATEDEEH